MTRSFPGSKNGWKKGIPGRGKKLVFHFKVVILTMGIIKFEN
jgi:hypothetical protein